MADQDLAHHWQLEQALIASRRVSRALTSELNHFQEMADATADEPTLQGEHRLWAALAAEVQAYLAGATEDVSLFTDESDVAIGRARHDRSDSG